MASATKTSRSRGMPVKENGMKLEEGLNVFKTDTFNADSFVQSKCSFNEKELRQLCSYLMDLKRASAEEMRKSVYANYAAFIRTSKEISELEGELLSIRNLLSTQATLIHGLAEGVNVDSLNIISSEGVNENGLSTSEDAKSSDLEKWIVEFPYFLDVLLAERRVDEALAALDEGEHVITEGKEKKNLSPPLLILLQTSINEHRQKLADKLAEAACQPSTRGSELRSSISALKKLGDGPRAHSLLLNAHLQRYQYHIQNLRPSNTSYGGAYTAALSQLVFSAITQAASDSMAIFGKEPAYTSELVVWATKQTEAFAVLVKRHALASSAAAGGLRAAAECVQIALGHCSLLETRGLVLCPILLKLFRPSVEQALDANLKRIEESTAALAAADDWTLDYPPTASRQSGRPSSASLNNTQYKLSSSAHRFNFMVQDFLEDVGPLLSMQLGGQTLEDLFQVFNSYVNVLIKALPGSIEEEANFEGSGHKIVRMAESDAQQIALLANASLLADELLPRAASKLSPLNQASFKEDPRRKASDNQNRNPEQREWRRRLVSSVDRLKDTFCRQHALDLIFTEEGDSHLTADMYINMDANKDEDEWFPSPIFQELFIKLNTMASIAADMFVGRERFATLLLMRVTETVILWLSEDQHFWDDMEEGPRPIGSLGLQQAKVPVAVGVAWARLEQAIWASPYTRGLGLCFDNRRHLDDTWVAYIGNDFHRILKWQKISTGCPSGRFGHTCIEVRDSIVLFGGINDNGLRQNDTWIGQITRHETVGITLSWRLLDVGLIKPPARGAHAVCSIGNKMVIHGGIGLFALRLNDTWVLDLSDNHSSGTWREIVSHSSPAARSGHTLTCICPNTAVLFAGRGVGYDVLADIWLFHMDDRYENWVQIVYDLQNIPGGVSLPRVGHSATLILGGRVLIHGGEDSYRHRKDDFWVLDINTTQLLKSQSNNTCNNLKGSYETSAMWKMLKSKGYAPKGRSFHRACIDCCGRYLYISGGMVDGPLQPADATGLRFDDDIFLVELSLQF